MDIRQNLFHSAVHLDKEFISLLAGGLVRTPSPSFYDVLESSCYMLLYTHSGNGSLASMGKTISLSENTLLFWDCEKPFKLNASSPIWGFHILFLEGNTVSSYYKYFQSHGPLYHIAPSSDIPSYLQRLDSLAVIDTTSKALTASKWLTDILTEICVVTMSSDTHETHIPAYIMEMKQLLDNSYEMNFSLTDFEKRFGISKYRLCREFSHHYQQPPIQYLNARRIDAAKDLLLTTDMPVHEVGSAVGIDNTNHFISLFKKNTGTTPFAFKQGAPASIRSLHFSYKPDCRPQ